MFSPRFALLAESCMVKNESKFEQAWKWSHACTRELSGGVLSLGSCFFFRCIFYIMGLSKLEFCMKMILVLFLGLYVVSWNCAMSF